MFGSPLFSWSPRPGQHQDVEASPATRTAANGSSVYSQSPALTNYTATPKIPFRGFWSRQQSPDPNTPSVSGDAPRDAGNAALPLSPPQAHHSAGSYIGAITPSQNPLEPTTLYSRHPADVQLPPGSSNSADPETRELADEVNGRRRRRRRHRRTPRDADRREQWVRRRDERGTSQIYVKGSAARGKMVACVISGTFLIAILSIYLAFALTDRNLGQEIHILFIMVLLTITIFFCHSLIRLCMLMLNPPSEEQQRFVPNMSGAEGFQPIIPIRVHLQRDEEAAVENEEALVSENVDDPEKHMPPPPPPAYGLWRSSVRADPNLLHWQRVDQANARTSARGRRSRNSPEPRDASPEPSAPEGPRPPSYVSEDGVSYIVEAAPRSTVTSTVSRDSHTGYSEIHPAWRPGYAMSEIRSGDLPIGTNSRP